MYTASGILRMLLAGGLAGIASWVLTYPVDVVKSRMQADKFENLKYNGIMDCIRKGIANEGSKFLYR